jgi:hypothetical protein
MKFVLHIDILLENSSGALLRGWDFQSLLFLQRTLMYECKVFMYVAGMYA